MRIDSAIITGSFSVNGDAFNDLGVLPSTGSNTFVGNQSIVGAVSASALTGSINYTNLTNVPTLVSGSEQIVGILSPLNSFSASNSTTNTFTSSATARLNSIETITSSNIARLNSLENKTGSLATTGSNIFYGNQTISGTVYIQDDLIVQGSSSLQNITASAVSIGTNIVNLNTANPSIRFAGLSIIDSGSVGGSGSFLYDSLQDEFIFVHRGAATAVTSSVILMGPETYDSIGSETYLTNNRLVKGAGNEHLADSNISDTGTLITLNSVTQITGSLLISSSLNVGSSNGSPLSKISFRDGVNTGSIALGNANYPTLLISDANNGEFRIDNRTSFAGGFISFYPNGQEFTPSAEAARIATNGFFGIGNNNPVNQLSVYTSSANTQNIMAEFYNGNFTSGTRNFVRVRNNVNAGSTMSSYFGQGVDGKTYIIANDFTKNHIVIDGNTTYVGIGISNPLGPLEVRAANRLVSADGILQVNTTNSQAIDLGGCLSFGGMYENSGTTPTEWAKISGRKENSTAGVYSGYLQFATRPSGGVNTERMRISSTGNIGVGITNPAVSLDISAKTDGIILPVGTTGQRPTAANGLIRYNTNAQSLETYVANNWVNVQTAANNGYGWRRPSTINIGGVLADGDRTWYSEINTANSYGSVVLNHVFTGNFTVVASWQRDYIGAGMVYKSGATLLDFNGFSADPNGPYFGGASTSGLSVGTYGSYNYLGLYPMPLGNGNTAATKYFIKWQRSGNTLTMQYSTAGPYGGWSNFSSGTSATCSSGDSVIVGAGEASGTENDPLRLLYVIE